MNRIVFLTDLRKLLTFMTEEERENTIRYYEGLLDDAGPEKEEELLREFGTPTKAAVTLFREYGKNHSTLDPRTPDGAETEQVEPESFAPENLGISVPDTIEEESEDEAEEAPEAGDSPDEPEETPEAEDVPDEPEETPEAEDSSDEAEEAPESEEAPDEPEEAPEAEDTPDEPEETPETENAPDEAEEAPETEDVPDEPAEAPETEDAPDEPEETPEAEAAPDEPEETPKRKPRSGRHRKAGASNWKHCR